MIIDKDFSVGKATEKMYKKTEWEFLLHNVVRVKHNLKGNETFELSLFGVLLVLTLIRYNDIGKLKHGLFYNSVSLSTYYDKIADNYRDKLPLVFGKWYLLKRILKIFSAYNFDILLDRETLSKAIGESIHNGGIKEFYVGMTSLAENNRHQMHKVQFSGLGALLNDTRYTNTRRVESDSHYQERVNLQYVNFRPIVQKLIEITVLLNPFDYDPDSFVEMLKSSNLFSEIKNPEYVSNLYDTQIIEEAFADEVSFLYYLSLQSSSFAISHPVNDYLVAQNENEAYFYTLNTQPEREILPPRFNNEDVYSFNRSFYPLLPKERLVSILQKDKEIKIWFSKWMQDLISCQEEVFKFMYVRFKELNIKSD